MTHPDPKAALEEILGRHQRYGLTSVCAGDHGTWAQWPCDAARVAKAMLGVVEAIKGLRIDANRLCDRNLGGSYEADCRRAIATADVALDRAAQDLEPK